MITERTPLIIGQVLLIGVLISFAIIVFGLTIYLLHHGTEIINYQIFPGGPSNFKSLPDLFHDALKLSGRSIIQLGIVCLVLVQILRVALTAWYFKKIHDWKFMWISLFILIILFFTFGWRF